MTAAVAVRDLTHRYRTATGQLTVLDGISLDIDAGGYLALTGPSGAGKTTLLSLLGGLEPVQSGRVEVDGVDLAGLSSDGLAHYRRRTVGFVFQHYGLLDTLTAAENIELARALSGAPPRRRRQEAEELLGAVGLLRRGDHLPHQLSGGERQRVAIARALANSPALLLADEPTGNLDEEAAERVLALLEGQATDRGTTLVVVTHNRAVAARAATRIRLVAGRSGRPDGTDPVGEAGIWS